jgi:hypothetical protein
MDWSDFWRPIIFIALLSAVVASCSSCSGTDEKPTLPTVIKAIKDACEDSGGVSKIEFNNEGKQTRVDSGACHPGKIYVR